MLPFNHSSEKAKTTKVIVYSIVTALMLVLNIKWHALERTKLEQAFVDDERPLINVRYILNANETAIS